MSIKQIQLKVQDLTLGMFVSGLDRPWSQTPFPLQGFYIRTAQDIASLKAYCSYVYIDVTKGKGPLGAGVAAPGRSRVKMGGEPETRRVRSGSAVAEGAPSVAPAPIVIRREVYKTTATMRMEAAKAQKIISQLKGNLTLVSKQIAKGRPVDYDALRRSADNMVSSVLRCPDAFTWLLRLRQKDQHTHDHSLRSAMWAVQFGRFAGMPKDELSILCLGTLLKDVGKLKLPSSLLRKKTRTPEEEVEYKTFVEKGVEMLRRTRKVEPRVISIVRYHCERHNGSGFPEGLMGSKIPLLARIAGIAATYDAISNPREALEPVAPSRAVSLLYNMRDEEFQEDLVVKFIQSVGLYPTGTLVELTTGDIGVVMDQHPQSRLTPKVVVLNRGGGKLTDNCVMIDLKEEAESRKILIENGREDVMNVAKLAIARDLEPTGYDVDLAGISLTFVKTQLEEKKTGLLAGIKDRFVGGN